MRPADPDPHAPPGPLLALGALGLAVAALRSPTLGHLGVGVAALWAAAALGFATRRPAPPPSPALAAVALPGVVAGAVALQAAGPATAWPALAVGLFAGGTAAAVVAALSLGASFGVLPAARGLVTGGPYRLVRHPMYAAQLVAVLGCALAAGGWRGALVLALAAVATAARVLAEERALADDPGWAAYRRAVPWRLVPRVW